MFSFQKLELYHLTKTLVVELEHFLVELPENHYASKQVREAAWELLAQVTKANAQFSFRNKQSCYIRARSHVFQLVAIFDLMAELDLVSPRIYEGFVERFTLLSKMLYGLIRMGKSKKPHLV